MLTSEASEPPERRGAWGPRERRRQGVPGDNVPRTKMNVGIVCYGSMGGSGIVATELGKALADRGHEVHVISADQPFRLGGFHPGLVFHQVNTPSYPLFREPQYIIGLSNTVVQVAREHGLDIIHAHYAV